MRAPEGSVKVKSKQKEEAIGLLMAQNILLLLDRTQEIDDKTVDKILDQIECLVLYPKQDKDVRVVIQGTIENERLALQRNFRRIKDYESLARS